MYRYGLFSGHGGGGPHVLGILFLIAFLIAVAALVVLAVRWARGGPAHTHMPSAAQPSRSDAALAAARMRYARGELSREDFLRISTDLQEHVSDSSSA
jgi:uncharacterized membrane protein